MFSDFREMLWGFAIGEKSCPIQAFSGDARALFVLAADANCEMLISPAAREKGALVIGIPVGMYGKGFSYRGSIL
jgi:hypothetical protein